VTLPEKKRKFPKKSNFSPICTVEIAENAFFGGPGNFREGECGSFDISGETLRQVRSKSKGKHGF